MIIKNAKFVTSVGETKRINEFNLPEIAVAGRSNVGKSSFINYLVNFRGLAKVSSTCGKTRLLNYFLINDEFYMVDLPGYGFAKVSNMEKERWANLIETYIITSKNLKLVLCLLDIRHIPNQNDKQLINFLQFNNIPFIIIATKCDKLSKAQRAIARQKIATELEIGRDDIIVTSAEKQIGKEEALAKIESFLKFNKEILSESICD